MGLDLGVQQAGGREQDTGGPDADHPTNGAPLAKTSPQGVKDYHVPVRGGGVRQGANGGGGTWGQAGPGGLNQTGVN